MGKTRHDRRSIDRSEPERGGRSPDPAVPRAIPASCPVCGGAAMTEAGSAAGGWWFVCDGCDHLWDERARRAEGV